MSTKAMLGTALVAIATSTAMAQSDYTETTNVSISGTNKTLDMVYVEGGTYQRGCSGSGCGPNESPVNSVTLSNYYVGKYEVTNAQWKAVMGDNTTANNQPKTSITWYDAIEFTCKLSEKTKKKYRLLTDAEFEYAARGGKSNHNNGHLYSGSNTADNVAWTSANSGSGYGAKDVGGKAANGLGIYDMSGNVYEWTHDSWGDYGTGPFTNPIDRPIVHMQKTRRGGSYDQPASESRVYARKIRSIEGKDGSIGFRLARSVNDSDPAAQIDPCDIHAPPPTGGKISFRDERLITEDDEVWLYDLSTYVPGNPMAYAIKIGANGAAKYTLIMNGNEMSYGDAMASGEWFTQNSYALYIGTKRYVYYVIDHNSMSLMLDGDSPGRYVRTKVSAYTGANKVTLPTIASPKTPEQLAQAQSKVTIDMANPPITGRDSRLIEGSSSAWLQDNVAMGAGGTHRYRKDFDDANSMRFVVWDAPTSTLLANGPWFTVDNTFLRVKDKNGATYDYLYSVSADGKKLYHISFQSYEIGDFRMFEKVSSSTNCTNTRESITCVQGWIEPAANATTYNQGASTYIPPSSNPVDPSSSSNGNSSSSAGNTSILSQIAVSNQATLMKSGMNLHTVNGATVEIYNIKGKLISRQNYASGIYSLSFANMPKGMYIAKVRFGSSKVKILRMPVM
jgi:formylglycine-generating enzyme required for sulfatase activity